MKEDFLIRSILAVPEVINEIYFLEPHHLTKFSEQYEFIKNRFNDLGEIYETDLILHGLELPKPTITYDSLGLPNSILTIKKDRIINLARHLFEEYHKIRILKQIKELKDGNLSSLVETIKNIIDSIDDEFQKNKLEPTIFDLIEPLFAKVYKQRQSHESAGINLLTLPQMNKIIGGIMPTDLIGIYGKEKSAKSSLALEMMLDICVDQKKPGIIFSYEMDNELMTMKSLSMRLGVPINEFRNPADSKITDVQFKEISIDAGRKFFNTNLYLVDQILDEYEIEAKIKKLLDKGIEIVLIDYLMLVSARNKMQSTRDELNYLTKFFKRVAQKYKIAIILISQANDAGERAAEAKGLERDSNYYFYVAKLEPNDTIKINGKEYTAGGNEEYVVKNRGIRHSKGGNYFILEFVENKLKEKTNKYDEVVHDFQNNKQLTF